MALLRYRAMLPFVYFLLAIDAVGMMAVWMIDPLPIARRSGGPSFGFMVNMALAAGLLIGFALSLGKTEKTESP